MSGEVFTSVQFGGDQPALDRKQVQEPYVVEGQNYLVDAEGPYSAFGQVISNYTRIEESTLLKSFEVDGEFFLFTDTVVLGFDFDYRSYYPLYIYEQASAEYWPWTHALVGGMHYFCRKGFGLIQYNPITKEWAEITGNGLATELYACLEVAGRLVVLSEDAYQWSDIDDGTQFATDTTKGTGAQALNLVGGGVPIGVYRTAPGFCVITTNGIIVVERIDAIQLTFRHNVLTKDIIPLDQFNIIQFGDDTILMLTKKGFYSTSGREPEAYQPLMSEYLTRQLFPLIDLSTVGLLQLFYSADKQLLFLSVSENETPFTYPYAHVLYLPVDKWGRFNRPHVAIGDFDLSKSPLTEDNLGYACRSTYLRVFLEYPIVELPPDDATLPQGVAVFFTDTIIYPARWQSGVIHFPSFINVSGIDRNDYPANRGLYTQSTHAPQPPFISSIDSYVTIGPYRVRGRDYAAYLNVLEQTAVGMLEEPPFVEDVDEMLLSGDVDEMTLTGDFDEGSGLFSGVSYTIEGLGTLDGYTVWDGQQEVLAEENSEGRIKFFSSDVHGMYIFNKISAQQLNQSFHLKFLENTVNLGGIL